MMLGYLLKVLKELSVGTSNKRALDGGLRLFFLFLWLQSQKFPKVSIE